MKAIKISLSVVVLVLLVITSYFSFLYFSYDSPNESQTIINQANQANQAQNAPSQKYWLEIDKAAFIDYFFEVANKFNLKNSTFKSFLISNMFEDDTYLQNVLSNIMSSQANIDGFFDDKQIGNIIAKLNSDNIYFKTNADILLRAALEINKKIQKLDASLKKSNKNLAKQVLAEKFSLIDFLKQNNLWDDKEILQLLDYDNYPITNFAFEDSNLLARHIWLWNKCLNFYVKDAKSALAFNQVLEKINAKYSLRTITPQKPLSSNVPRLYMQISGMYNNFFEDYDECGCADEAEINYHDVKITKDIFYYIFGRNNFDKEVYGYDIPLYLFHYYLDPYMLDEDYGYKNPPNKDPIHGMELINNHNLTDLNYRLAFIAQNFSRDSDIIESIFDDEAKTLIVTTLNKGILGKDTTTYVHFLLELALAVRDDLSSEKWHELFNEFKEYSIDIYDITNLNKFFGQNLFEKKKINNVLNRYFYPKEDAEYDIVYIYSFWARRANEGNIDVVYKIMNEIHDKLDYKNVKLTK